jgi:N-acetyl-gamma-glutamyl-phosphate reductase
VNERFAQPLAGDSAARVVVAGASGFAGALAAQIVWDHPRLELAAVTARTDAGSRLDRVYPRYRVPLELAELDMELMEDVDAAIVAYPHAASAPVVAEMRGLGVQVVDLSADFRLRDAAVYEKWYGPHGEPQLLADAVYGLPELHRERIRNAELVANPGCYPTAALLALAPLAEQGLIADVVIDAKQGISGAGRGGGDEMHFVTLAENAFAYKVDAHRHTPEIEQEMSALGFSEPVTFVPHLLPLDQGELTTCFVTPAREIESDELRSIYEQRYADEPFVRLSDVPPGVRDVRDTNECHLHAAINGRKVVALSAIDNLWKGAAGQAVQNLNLMLGLDEGEGLR